MRTIMTAMSATALLCAVSACDKQPDAAAAADPIDGTWKADLASVQIDEKPSVYLLKDGTYECSTCVPPLSVRADGTFHPVKDRPYYDNISVKVVDDQTVKTVRRKGDRVISETTVTASTDGNKLTYDWREAPIGNAPPVTGKTTEMRVAATPTGAHVISGSWKTEKFSNISDEGLTVSFDAEGDTLRMTSPVGTSYVAKFGGPAVPVNGDDGGTTIAVERLAANSIRETSTRGGKVVNVTTFTITEGKLNATSENKLEGSTLKYAAVKQ